MANPQIEDGHVDIANELVDALAKTYLSPAESKVIWTILRKTYGWHKKTDRISYSQFEEATGMNRWHLGAAVKRLIARNIISVSGPGYSLEYGIQKNYELWQIVTQNSNESLPKSVTKEKTTKVSIEVQLKEIFDSFKVDSRYAGVNFDNEYKKFCEYWLEGKRKLKNKKLACHNWLDSALRHEKQFGGNNGVNKKPTSRQLPKQYTTPEEYDAEQGGHNVPN